ncbi:MAG: hypothetical protein ACRD2L_14485, partial [Terriglobia bacterium]
GGRWRTGLSHRLKPNNSSPGSNLPFGKDFLAQRRKERKGQSKMISSKEAKKAGKANPGSVFSPRPPREGEGFILRNLRNLRKNPSLLAQRRKGRKGQSKMISSKERRNAGKDLGECLNGLDGP